MTDTPTIIKQAVVVLIRDDLGRVLFIQRPMHDSYGGYWNPVTGGADDSDHLHLCETARREAHEEAGLDVEVLGKLWESTTRGAHYVLHWMLARTLGNPAVKPDTNEVADWRWLLPSELGALSPVFADTRMFFAEIWAEAVDVLETRRASMRA